MMLWSSLGLRLPLLVAFYLLAICLAGVSAQECSDEKLCSTGCCSKYGFCGTGDDFCSADNCVSTCNYKLGCDASNPCAAGQGCCSKFGFCGLGPDYCAPEVCVAGCDSKSYCDPGYGSDGYAEVESCPLNVCCSKWGFCGLTEEFCGTKTVSRPSCGTSGPIGRVVGYYEGWAAKRTCDAYLPVDIPIGVYTHINFAFAGIDPSSFAVVPASESDTLLYSQVTGLKRLQPGLKVFISIGGWTFNDPGRTQTTFSDLAASSVNQAKFFASLISFMSTYDFDGVDLDWEYPAADDRSGRPEDFENFPTLLYNLKSALQGTGGRSGLSITLPASYWYLQHFNITTLTNTVDFVNMMTYDLHGLWDKGNKWLGAFLNGHTNLTEIATDLDLLWRNHIDPAKVNLGLAFYARTFTMADPSCSEPGCMFVSAGAEGPCTQSVGTLSNSEIADIIAENNLTPVHYADAAVKVVTWGDQWVAYDDGDTFQQKLDFARGECLGGVMVWALSEDSANVASSLSLPDATEANLGGVFLQERTPTRPTSPAPTSYNSFVNQCRWSNCGEGCGDGWQAVPRSPSGTKGENFGAGETMQDSSKCGGGNLLRQFCCPVDSGLPICGWYNFNNGHCSGSSGCPSGFTEVGSYGDVCNNGDYQNACCSIDVDSMKTYDQCVWNGQVRQCSKASISGFPDSGCGEQYVSEVVIASEGSGGVYCGADRSANKREYCCLPPSPVEGQFINCDWYAYIGSIPPGATLGFFCASGCPGNKVKVGLDIAKCGFGGAFSWCCEADYNEVKLIADDPTYQSWLAAVNDVENNSYGSCIAKKRDTGSTGAINSLEKRQLSTSAIFLAQLLQVILQLGTSTPLSYAGMELWDEHVETPFPFLSSFNLQSYVKEAPSIVGNINDWVNDVVCNLPTWNDIIQNFLSPTMVQVCYLGNLSDSDPDFWDGDLDNDGSLVSRREFGLGIVSEWWDPAERLGVPVERIQTGPPRTFTAVVGVDSAGNPITLTLTSVRYPNGGNGQGLITATGSSSRYTLANPIDCTSTTFTRDAPEGSLQWVVEHIYELQTASMLMRYLATLILPPINNDYIDAPGFDSSNLIPIPVPLLTSVWDMPYRNWSPAGDGLDDFSPSQLFMAAFGSVANPTHLVLADAVFNQIKARVWGGMSPFSSTAWAANNWDAPIVENAYAAMSALRAVLSVSTYLNDNTINGHVQATIRAITEVLLDFQNRIRSIEFYQQYEFSSVEDLVNEFNEAFFAQRGFFIRCWVTNHIPALEQTWRNVELTSTDTAMVARARAILDQLELLKEEASPPPSTPSCPGPSNSGN